MLMWDRLFSLLVFIGLLAASGVVQAKRCTVYVYLDHAGKTHKTRNLKDVPADKRASLLTYKDDCTTKLRAIEAPAKGLPAEAFETDGSLTDPERNSATSDESYQVPDTWTESRQPPSWLRYLMWLSLLLIIGGTIGVVIEAFRQSILWGLAVLILPFVWLIFSILAWHRVKVPFLAGLVGYIGLGVTSMVIGFNLLF